jgi:3-dehydroquinate synthase
MKPISHYQVFRETTTNIAHVDSWTELSTAVSEGYSKVIWVIDCKIGHLIPFNPSDHVIGIKGGDEGKNLEIFYWLVGQFSDQELDRKGHVVTIGGGSVSDLAGFAASVYLRGVSFSIVPSTLLSLIDASIGGKNGINFRQFKNQIGTIHQPKAIYYFPEILNQLPAEEMADGFAEIIKYGLILDAGLFKELLSQNLGAIMIDEASLHKIIYRCIIHKSSIVKEDPFEESKRRILNFGHTVGHAIESIYGLSHGKSVGLGMLFAAKMSENYYDINLGISSQIQKVLGLYKLPTGLESFSAMAIYEKIKADKKREGDAIFFILLKELGKASIEKMSLDKLKEYLIKAEQEKWMLS